MQSETCKNVEYCWRDQEREVKEGGPQRSEGKQSRVTDLKRHQGIGPEEEEGSYNLIHIKNGWWRRGVIKVPLSNINIK